jgi:ABC-type sulfate transport system permease component
MGKENTGDKNFVPIYIVCIYSFMFYIDTDHEMQVLLSVFLNCLQIESNEQTFRICVFGIFTTLIINIVVFWVVASHSFGGTRISSST